MVADRTESVRQKTRGCHGPAGGGPVRCPEEHGL